MKEPVPKHALTLQVGVNSSQWKIERRSRNFSNYQFASDAISSHFSARYLYSHNLLTNFYLVLGSSVRYMPKVDNFNTFQPGDAIQFPSLIVGATARFNSFLKYSGLLEYSAIYYPNMKIDLTEDGTKDFESFKTFPDTISVQLEGEFFANDTLSFTLNTQLRLDRYHCFLQQSDCKEKAYALLPITARHFGVSLGTTYYIK